MSEMDEEAAFRRKLADFFTNVQRGDVAAVTASLQRAPPKNFRGEIFPWLTVTHQGEQTALHVAAQHGHASMVELLGARGADVHTVDAGGETGLHAAAVNNHTEAMSLLLHLGVSVDAQSKTGCTALHRATTRGHLDAMRLLLQSRAPVDLADRANETPLMVAARENMLEPSAILLSCGASLHATDRDGRTAIHHCIPGHTTNLTHLFWFSAASKGDVPALRRLLGQQIGSVGDEGWKELGRALYQPQGQDQLKLNKHRTLCNATDALGCTALSRAVQADQLAAVSYLLSQAADPGISDSARETPLHHAARLGSAELTQALLSEKAPLEACNLGDVTALHVASFLGHDSVCDALIRANANVHAYDKQHETPLHHAVAMGHAKVVQSLVSGGASLSVRDQDGKTVGIRASEAAQNRDKPRPRRKEDAADYKEDTSAPRKPAEEYEVVHSGPVAVRAGASIEAKAVGCRMPGERVLVREVVNGWARLDGGTSGGEHTGSSWMLLDATEHGLGPLLRPAPAAPAPSQKTAADGDAEDDESDGDYEG